MLRQSFQRQCRGICTLRSTTALPGHIIPTFRQHPPSSASPPPTFPFLNPDLVPPRPSFEELSPAGKLYKLTWPVNPRNILVVKKRKDDKVREAAITFARYFPFRDADVDISMKSIPLISLWNLVLLRKYRIVYLLHILLHRTVFPCGFILTRYSC
jgi:hypothetical protein